MIQVASYYWISTTPGASASAFAQWSSTPGGAPLGSWPGSSPDASDDFFFTHVSTANCNWDIAAVQSIQQSLVTAELYTGVITIATNVALKGLILNGEITDAGGSKTLTFSGANLSALSDTSSRKRYVLNGQKAKHGSGSTLLYKMQPASNDVHLDNGPYNKLTIDTQTMTLAYSVPTASTHDNADDGTIHIKGAFVVTAGAGFVRASAPNGALDTQVKIKFDTTSISYGHDSLDFNMATAFFRGTEIPVTGSQTYGTSANGFTVKHYGVVVFAASNGEQATIRNGLSLNCYSLEVKAGARLTCQTDSGKPVQINSQSQPIIRGVWSFQSSDGHTYISPRATYVSGVGSGGTGLSEVEPNALLIGNASSAMSDLVVVPPGTNGHVLTLVAGVPTWAASSGGGGGSGTVTSVATSAPITGGTITGSGTIGISAATTSAAGSMSSADKTKLNGIETAADVTDTANVTAAGALMDSEVTNLAQVKAFDSADYATAAQGAKADSAQQPPSEGPFVNGDKTKLDGIAASATAYTDANAIAAVEGESTLDLTGAVTVQTDLKMTTSSDNAIIENVTQDKDIIFKINDGGASTEVMRIDGDVSRVGIGTDSPENRLHVKTTVTLTDAAYAARFQTAEGNVGITRYGGLHVDNDNTSPLDGAAWSSQRWQISQRDSDHFDIAYGTPINTNVPAGDTDLRITNTGNVGIGLGNTNPSAKLHVNGTIRQTNATSAVLVADSNGDISAASNLTDQAYLAAGQAETDAFNAIASAAAWVAPPPATIQQAIDRLAAYVITIPGAPPQIP